jgi:HSP20 family molecular chaperone IbpA
MEKEMVKSEVIRSMQLMPLVDILDGDQGVTMWFEIPGAAAKDVNIEVHDGMMSMCAKSSLRRGGRSIEFKRSFRLAEGIDPEKIVAKTQDGVLELHIPKSERAKVHKIKVS